MKTPIIATTCLILGMIVGWIIKPASKSEPTEISLAEMKEGSVLPISPTAATQSKSSSIGTAGESTKTLETLLAIFEDHGHSTGGARAYQFLINLSSQDLLRLAQSMESINKGSRYQYAAVNAILGRWAEIDPESLFAHALKATDSSLKQRGLTQAIEAIANRNRSRARTLVSTIEDPNLRSQTSRLIIRAAAKDDPVGALASLSSQANLRYERDNIFRSWGEKEPQAAAKHLETVTGTQARREAIRGLAQSWGGKDPETALEWASSMNNRLERREAMRQIMSTLGDLTKGKALLENLNLKGEEHRMAVNALASKVLQEDFDRAVDWIDTLEPRERATIIADHLSLISTRDPERARKLFGENMNARMRHQADNIASTLAQTDLASAQAWVDSLPQSETKQYAIQGIVNTLQETDPQAALDYLDTIGYNSRTSSAARNAVQYLFDQDQAAALQWVESKKDPQLTYGLVNHWALQDPTAAAAYASKLEDPEQQNTALRGVIANWTQSNPEEAIAHYETLEAGTQRAVMHNLFRGIADVDIDRALTLFENTSEAMTDDEGLTSLANVADDLVDKWAEVDVSAAATWAIGLQQPESRAMAIEEAAREWIRQDSMAASEWIGELPDSPNKDTAIRRLVSHVATHDPSSAFAWANTLSDDSRRASELHSVLGRWKRTDPEGALQALQSANLSDEAYNKLAKQFEE